MKALIVIGFSGVLFALGTALVFLLRDRGAGKRTLNALRMRVLLSVTLLIILWFSWYMGWIAPRQY